MLYPRAGISQILLSQEAQTWFFTDREVRNPEDQHILHCRT